VIVFLPNIMILYLFISFMEDSGYLARAAFIMDRVMHRIGVHGKSFIPLIMGFGCNACGKSRSRSRASGDIGRCPYIRNADAVHSAAPGTNAGRSNAGFDTTANGASPSHTVQTRIGNLHFGADKRRSPGTGYGNRRACRSTPAGHRPAQCRKTRNDP
jgi:hypothetical protein